MPKNANRISNDPTSYIASKEETQKKSSSIGLFFPSDLMRDQNNFKAVKFDFYEYDKPAIGLQEKRIPIETITLPMPPALGQNDSFDYNDFDGGLLAAAVDSTPGSKAKIQGAIKQFSRGNLGGAYNAIKNNTGDDEGKSSGGVLGKLGLSFAAAAITPLLGDDASYLSSVAGMSLNPKAGSTFSRVGLRTYEFSYQMIAQNPTDSDTIRKIIKQFRYHSYPIDEGPYFRHPNLLYFSFLPSNVNDYLFEPNLCAITGINVSYNGNATPTFFQETGAPVEVVLSFQLKELIHNSRSDYGEVVKSDDSSTVSTG